MHTYGIFIADAHIEIPDALRGRGDEEEGEKDEKVQEKLTLAMGATDAYRAKGRGFDSRSGRHVATLDKFFARSCLWRFDVKLQHRIRAVSGAPLNSSVDLKRRSRNSLNE